MKAIISQFAHIFIHYYSNKSSATCKLFLSEPNRFQEDKMGRLFGVIEINTPSRENSAIINEIINFLEESYYSRAEETGTSIESLFEQSLEEANQKFQQILKEKQYYLVGNLNEFTIKEKINLTIGVLKNKKLCLSYLNNIGLYLIHKGKQDYKIIDIRKISVNDESPQDGKDDQTQKLFTNIINGELAANDYLFAANSSFLNYISLERIKKIVTSLPVNKAAEYFKNSLLQNEGYNFAAIIVKNSTNQPESQEKSQSLSSISELNYTESSTEKLLAPSLWTSLKGFARSTMQVFIKEKEKQQTGEKAAKKTPQEAAQPDSTRTGLQGGHQNSLDKIKLLPNIFGKSIKIAGNKFKKQYSNIQAKTPKLNEKFFRLRKFLRLKIAYLGGYLKKIPGLSKILLVVAFVFIILFLYSTSYFKHQKTEQVDNQEFNNQAVAIEDKINSAESNLIIGDEGKAKQDITDAQSLLAGLNAESNREKEKQDEINNRLQTVIAKLRRITTISDLILITDLSAQQENNININNIVYQNNTIFAFDSINNNTYKINPDNKEVKTIYSNLSDIGKIARAKIINNTILIYQDKNGFISFENDKFSPYTVSLPPNGKLSDFATYADRLYTVDTANNQIYRHAKDPNGYGAAVPWLQESADLSKVNSIGIDTNIWMLGNDGQILKYNKGKKQGFSIKDLEPKLESATRLCTNDESNYLYILDSANKRLIVLDKNGNLKTQYYSEKFGNLKDMVILEKDKKAFLVSDNSIYFFNLNN